MGRQLLLEPVDAGRHQPGAFVAQFAQTVIAGRSAPGAVAQALGVVQQLAQRVAQGQAVQFGLGGGAKLPVAADRMQHQHRGRQQHRERQQAQLGRYRQPVHQGRAGGQQLARPAGRQGVALAVSVRVLGLGFESDAGHGGQG